MPDLLLLCEYATLNGGERSMLAILDGVRAAGYRVTVVAPPEGPLADVLTERNVPVIPFQWTDDAGTRPPQAELRRSLRNVIQQHRPDLIHANSLSTSRLSGPVAADLRVPSIGHLRDIVRLSATAIADLNRHTRLLAVSHATRDYHVAAGLGGAETHVLYNGIDLDRFRPRSPTGYLHRELNLSPDALLVGSIGQIGVRKGLDVLIRSARSVVTRDPWVHFLIVGRRYSRKDEAVVFEEDLKAAAAAEPLVGHVHFLDWRDDVAMLLNELTLLVHAARQEPLGRVLLEAAASGVPVIATDVGGTEEIFPRSSTPENRGAVLVPQARPKPLAHAILRMLANEAERRRLGTAARRRVQTDFDASTSASGLIAHYRAIM